MPVSSLEMPVSYFIRNKLEPVQLGYGGLQCLANTAKSPDSRPFGGSRHAEQEVRAVGIVVPVSAAVRFPDEMRHQVEIPDRAEKVDDLAEWFVYIHLFQVRLGHPLGIVLILRRGPLEDLPAPLRHNLVHEDRTVPAARLGRERDLVRPIRGGVVVTN